MRRANAGLCVRVCVVAVGSSDTWQGTMAGERTRKERPKLGSIIIIETNDCQVPAAKLTHAELTALWCSTQYFPTTLCCTSTVQHHIIL